MEEALGNTDILVAEGLAKRNEKTWSVNIMVLWEPMDKSFKKGMVDSVKCMYET